MRDRVLDVWADLRDRRLWPVAALLLLALVAVPVVLVQPAEEAPSQAATPASQASPGSPLAKDAVIDASSTRPLVQISNLDQFSSKDPFKPLRQLGSVDKTGAIVATTTGTGTGGGAQTGSSGGGLGAQGGQPSGGGQSTPGGAGGGGSKPGGTPTAPRSPLKKYTYVVDLTFADGRGARHYRSFDRLGMLPSEYSPLLVFLGVDATGSKAAFLVDSTLDAGGEGACKPSPASCGVLYLRPGEKESFNDGEGNAYTLVLDQLRQVEVRSRASASAADQRSAGDSSRRFLFPVLIDLETGGQR